MSRIALLAIPLAVAAVVGVLAAALNEFRWTFGHILLSAVSLFAAYLICKDEAQRRDSARREKLLIAKAAKWINNPAEARRARERTKRVLEERRREQEMRERPDVVEAKVLILATVEGGSDRAGGNVCQFRPASPRSMRPRMVA
ncbi:hypothetical protein [Nonomuraea sp. GTA35]|uniref:hypothetical protein n=1 Tax=Nonomuraea sp. GTA35 TaxID=1676746 RepID=UPI0035BFCB85